MLPKKEGGVFNEERREIVTGLLKSLQNPPYVLTDDIRWIYASEIELCGTNITCSKLDFKNTSNADSKCVEFSLGKSGKMSFNVEILETKEYTIKNGKSAGKKMAFLKVSDDTGKMDCLIFDETWEKYKDLCYEGNTITIIGYRSKKDTLIIETIGDL